METGPCSCKNKGEATKYKGNSDLKQTKTHAFISKHGAKKGMMMCSRRSLCCMFHYVRSSDSEFLSNLTLNSASERISENTVLKYNCIETFTAFHNIATFERALLRYNSTRMSF